MARQPEPDGWNVIICDANGVELTREPFRWTMTALIEAEARAAELLESVPNVTVRIDPYFD